MTTIEEVVARRTDLSTFVVHLTRDLDDSSAKDNLKSILRTFSIGALSPFGQATASLPATGPDTDSQKAVCFTETPLEHVSLLLEPIPNRICQFGPYGIGVTKKQARTAGVNPVWYVDITPGHNWLTGPLNNLVNAALASGNFATSDIARLTPFIEQMGTRPGHYRKEFWWEREWRHIGDFHLPDRFLVFCPEPDWPDMLAAIEEADVACHPRFIDPAWGLEQIIGRLAGYSAGDVGPF